MKKYHETKNGEKMLIAQMDDTHLINTIKLYASKIEQSLAMIDKYSTLKESEKIKIEGENGGVICLMFKTENIAVGILSIYYETENLNVEEGRLLSELSEILIVSLRSAKFYELSMKDSLTGIYNRSIMNFYLKKMMEEKMSYILFRIIQVIRMVAQMS